MKQGEAAVPRAVRRRRASVWSLARLVLGILVFAVIAVPAPAVFAQSFKAPVLKAPAKGTVMDVVADRFTHNSSSNVSIAIGNVFIVYGPYRLKADQVIYDRGRDILKAMGNVWLREPNGNILKAADLTLDDKFRTGFANFVKLLLTNDATLQAVFVRREEGPVSVFEQVTYTRCKTCVTDGGKPLWELKSDKATYVEEEHLIYHDNARLEFLGIPVFWLPKISHPDPQTKKATGFLVPTFGYSDTLGAQAEIPFFWNLAPNYDLTLRPRITSKQGPLLRAIWRHHLGNGTYSIDGSGIYQLNPGKLTSPGNERWRGALRSEGHFYLSPHWTFGWDGTLTSDDTYLKRYKIDKADTLISTAYLTGLKDRNYYNAAAYHYQSTIGGISDRTLPVVHPHTYSQTYFGSPVIGGELSLTTNSYALTRSRGVDASHYTAELYWQRQMINGAGMVITPFGQVRADYAESTNVLDPSVPGGIRGKESEVRAMPKGGLDIRWPFISAGPDSQHIITPAVQVVAATDERRANRLSNEDSATFSFDPTNQFLKDRFNGYDRMDGGTRADIGIIYNYLMNHGGFARFAVGQSYHVAGRNSFARGSGLENTRSDYVASVAVQPWDGLRLSYLGQFDPDSFDPTRQEASALVNTDRLALAVNYGKIDASPAFLRPTLLHQVWFDGSFELSRGWHLLGGIRYDLRNDYLVTNHVGIGYYCDCAVIKLTYKENRTRDRDVEPDRAVLLSVEFKTLGTAAVGTSVN
ncbi:MAG: LPS assembly protein LptD [Pseudomonadota bacterium]